MVVSGCCKGTNSGASRGHVDNNCCLVRRRITDAHGHLVGDSLISLQHIAMYGAVMVYATVALLVHFVGVGKLLPAGTEQVGVS